MSVVGNPQNSRLRLWLANRSGSWLTVFAVAMAFTCYFCMYSFRKPFAAATYENQTLFGLDLKIALVISQVLGYALSKALGIKFNSEISRQKRAWALAGTILWAEGALLLFALTPPGGQAVAIFLNGLSLGLVWGLVFSFLEGRRTSEVLGAGLSCSYIVASGYVKSVGRYLYDSGVPESWMPFTTGALFLPFFLISVWGLSQLPAPNIKDIETRTRRIPMDGEARWQFFRKYAFGLLVLVAVYVFLTAYRDFRDNFAVEIWQSLGYGEEPSIFTKTEVPIAICVMAMLALLSKVKDNRVGLLCTYVFMTGGALLLIGATWLFDLGLISPMNWMIGVGLGLYLSYVPFGCVLFDRTIAVLGVAATSVFLIYMSDAAAYTGSVAVLFYKQFGSVDVSYLHFFRYFSYATGIATSVLLVVSGLYFFRRAKAAVP